jgi:nucleoside-diphosphate-sugar epimerase
MVAERVLLSYADKLVVQIIRPATVCGYSPRMRLDVSVNMLTMQALTKEHITVFGGSQVRPNIHIDDITDVYLFMLEHPRHHGIYNAGFENISIMDIARRVAGMRRPGLVTDRRSALYQSTPTNCWRQAFGPKSVDDAIREIVDKFRRGQLKGKDRFTT